ncbi:unnamed protein product [Prunus armeniaca]
MFTAFRGCDRAGKVPKTALLRRKVGTALRRKGNDAAPVIPHVTPKRHSMSMLQARFTSSRTSNSGQLELENQRRELHALILAKGVSADGADCVAEAAAR